MGEVFLMFIGLFIVTAILIGTTLRCSSDKSLSLTLIVCFVFTAVLGFMNYTAVPTNYYFDKILAIWFVLLYLIPIALHFSKKAKPVFIKILSVLILIANLILLIV